MLDEYKIPGLPGSGRNKNNKNNKNKGLNKNKNMKVMTAGRIILLAFLSLLFIFFLLIYLFLNFYRPAQSESFTPKWDWGNEFSAFEEDNGEAPQNTPQTADGKNPDCYTFVIAGIDKLGGTTDTLMLVMFNVKEHTVSILNIPRDTYVSSRNYTSLINGVYANGRGIARKNGIKESDKIANAGMAYLCEMIKYTYGVPVDRYVLINLEGFKVLVDEVKGVEMYVPLKMKYDDPEQGLHINLQQGQQLLDGNKAEQVIRFRHGNIYRDKQGNVIGREPNYYDIGFPGEDIGRIKTQQAFLAALAKKIINPIDINNIISLFEVGSKYTVTNMTTANVLWFAQRLTNVKLENIRFHTLPGAWVGSVGRQNTYKQEAIEIINKYYNPFRKEIPESSFNIYDRDLLNWKGTKPEIDIDGVTMANMLS